MYVTGHVGFKPTEENPDKEENPSHPDLKPSPRTCFRASGLGKICIEPGSGLGGDPSLTGRQIAELSIIVKRTLKWVRASASSSAKEQRGVLAPSSSPSAYSPSLSPSKIICGSQNSRMALNDPTLVQPSLLSVWVEPINTVSLLGLCDMAKGRFGWVVLIHRVIPLKAEHFFWATSEERTQ